MCKLKNNNHEKSRCLDEESGDSLNTMKKLKTFFMFFFFVIFVLRLIEIVAEVFARCFSSNCFSKLVTCSFLTVTRQKVCRDIFAFKVTLMMAWLG